MSFPADSCYDVQVGDDNSGERRRHARLHALFPARVRSVDAGREAFEIHTLLDNFSAGGLYVRLERRLEPGTRFFATVRISTAPAGVPAPHVAIRGVVLRVESYSNGLYGIAVRFTRYRFL